MGELGNNNPYRTRVKPDGISDPYSWAGTVAVAPDRGTGPFRLGRWRSSPTLTMTPSDYPPDANKAANERLQPELRKGAD